MHLLLDTHIVVWTIDKSLDQWHPEIARLRRQQTSLCFVSTASLWEIKIKHDLGKLKIDMQLAALPEFLEGQGMNRLGVAPDHVVHGVDPMPRTRDPFDRLLLAQAQIEGMRLVAVDTQVAGHPVTFR